MVGDVGGWGRRCFVHTQVIIIFVGLPMVGDVGALYILSVVELAWAHNQG